MCVRLGLIQYKSALHAYWTNARLSKLYDFNPYCSSCNQSPVNIVQPMRMTGKRYLKDISRTQIRPSALIAIFGVTHPI